MSETTQVVVEAFGSIKSESDRTTLDGEPIDYKTVIAQGMEHLDSLLNFDDIDEIVTGMDGDTTYAIEHAIEQHNINTDVNAWFINVQEWQNDDSKDDISDDFQEAWKTCYNWRNQKLLQDNSDTEQGNPPVEMVIRFGDAGNSGDYLLEKASSKGVSTLNVNLDQFVDRDSAYSSDSENPEEAEA